MATVDALHDILCARNERTVAMETDRERDREERESVDPDSWREREKQGRIHGIRHLFSPLKRRRYRPTDSPTDGPTDRKTLLSMRSLHKQKPLSQKLKSE